MYILDRFINAVGTDPGNCVLVVGSGLSKQGVRAEGKGLPDWDDLMRLMIHHLASNDLCTKPTIEQLRVWLAEDPPRYLDIAEEFCKAHAEIPQEYEQFLHRHLKPSDLEESELHRLIVEMGFRGIVSYNFDMIFEKHSDRLIRVVYPDILDQIHLLRNKGYLLKIHGCVERPASQLVLTRSSFERFSGDSRYRELLRSVFVHDHVLCAGFSLRDPNFRSMMEDIKVTWDTKFPTVFALMQDPGQKCRADWLDKRVVILRYADHSEVKEFFQEWTLRCKAGDDTGVAALNGRSRLRRSSTTSRGAKPDASLSWEARGFQEFVKEWQGKQKVGEMDAIMSEHLSRLLGPAEREAVLFRVGAMCRSRERPHLCHHLIAVGTPACFDLTRQIIRAAAEDDQLRVLSPDRVHVPIHQWVLREAAWPDDRDALENFLKWILDADWAKHGVDVSTAFREVLSRVANSSRERVLDSLYRISEHIPGAAAEIERVALAPGFVRTHDQVERSWDRHVVEEIKQEKLRRAFLPLPRSLSPAAMLAQAAALEGPEDEYCPYVRVAARFLLTDFVHRAHLGLHHSSSLYDPAKAREIVDALAALRSPRQQITVLWAINHWAEDHRGLGSLQVDSESLREGLLVPLWWRYSSEARIQYLQESGRHRGMVPSPQWTGQEFLLHDMMGLRYDVDEDFRREFNKSLEYYDNRHGEERYNPWPLQALWRDRELTYEIVDDLPPELARRVVTRRVDPESSQNADRQWEEAEQTAQALLEDRDGLQEIVSAERRDYVVDNLLGAYSPSKRRVVLYQQMLSLAALDLTTDCDALSTVVYIHETVHAFAHLGRDLSNRMWNACGVPDVRVPDYQPGRTMEAIAQFYTHKLLERLGDERLLNAFLKLEDHSDPIYREWRKTEHYTLEAMRAALMQFRDSETKWPPAPAT